jgi:hypothetical protein
MTDLTSSQPLVKEAGRVIAQHPNDCGASASRDQAPEKRDQQSSSDALILPIRGNIKGEHLAGKKTITPVWPAAAETADDAASIYRDTDITRLPQDYRTPTGLAAPLRQPNQIGGGEHTGVGRPPGLYIEAGDGTRI